MENNTENKIENTTETTETIEKKPTKKALIIGIIAGVIVLIAIGLGLYFGTKTPNETGKKEDKIESETNTDTEENEETNEEENEGKEEDKTDTTENESQLDATDDTQSNVEEPVVTRTTMYAKSNVNVRSGAGTSNSKIGSLTKGQEIVKIGEENGWSKIEFNGGTGYVKFEYLSTEKIEVETNSNSNINSTTGNNTSSNNGTTNNSTSNNNQGNTSTPSTSGMYTMLDTASKERFSKCGSILQGGLAGQYMQWQEDFIDYFDGSIVMINGTTGGAWMYMNITGWPSYGGSEETAPTYNELPALVKQCLETIAPEGGTQLYNTVYSLISQYKYPMYVPTQGRISESIPGLYVTLTDGKSGLEIRFYAE